MIELKLLPDGAAKVPQEARDDSILATYLENDAEAVISADISENAASSWREIARVIPGHGKYIALRVPGEQVDYSQTTLDGFRDAIVDNIGGLKTHPNGWEAVERS